MEAVRHDREHGAGNTDDTPRTSIPLLTAANGVKSMRLAGTHGSAGKYPSDLPVLVEQYVVVGTKEQAQRPAELWRFGRKAFKTYFNDPSPRHIQQRADAEIPINQVPAKLGHRH